MEDRIILKMIDNKEIRRFTKSMDYLLTKYCGVTKKEIKEQHKRTKANNKRLIDAIKNHNEYEIDKFFNTTKS